MSKITECIVCADPIFEVSSIAGAMKNLRNHVEDAGRSMPCVTLKCSTIMDCVMAELNQNVTAVSPTYLDINFQQSFLILNFVTVQSNQNYASNI